MALQENIPVSNTFRSISSIVINLVNKRPEILAKENDIRLLGDSLLSLLFNVLVI